MEALTVVDREAVRWPTEWDNEAAKATRYPRRAGHWFASRRNRRDRVRALCSELDALIARRIRSERVAAGLRQVDLADAIGATQATISRIESGKSPATVADLVRIAIQLGRPLEAFITAPRGTRKTGWERHPTVPLIPRDVCDAAERGELPLAHPIYD